MSESTLKNNIRKINNLFKYLNIRLITRKNEIYLNLIGDEAIIRYWCSSILCRTYNGLKWPLPTMNKNKLSKLKFLIFENSDISFGKQNVFIFFIAVCIVRSNSNHCILPNKMPEYYYNLTHNIDYFYRIAKRLQYDFSLNGLEKDFILLLFYIFPDFYKSSGTATYTLEELKRKSPKNFYNITKYIELVQNKHPNWNIKSEDNQLFFYAAISSHIATDILKEAFFNLQDLNIIEFASKEFPTLLPSMQELLTPINPSLTSGKLKSLIFRLAQAHLLAFSPKDFEPELKILVISDSPIQIKREMVFKIKSLLNNKYHIKLSTDQSEFDKCDLIIFTGFYEGIDPSIPIIFVFPQIEKRDERAILDAC